VIWSSSVAQFRTWEFIWVAEKWFMRLDLDRELRLPAQLIWDANLMSAHVASNLID
jgi:hypothetical protein